MRNRLRCGCHICKIEHHLILALRVPPRSDEFSRLVAGVTPLAGFSSALALVEHLHSPRPAAVSIVPSPGELVGALIQKSAISSEVELRNSVLVLCFIPMIHRTYHEVRAWFREIEPDDIAQQILTMFLELVDSTPPILMNNHLPIALTRSIRKSVFRWAEKEKRIAIQREFDKSREIAEPSASDTFEAVSLLNDFLDYCQRTGVLSIFERDLLIRLKIDGFFAKEIIHTHTALSEKAVHWRVERIVQRLQKAAANLGTARSTTAPSLGPNSSQKQQKDKNILTTAGNLFLGSGNEFLPISNSRRQLSLDSSPSQSQPKPQQLPAIHLELADIRDAAQSDPAHSCDFGTSSAAACCKSIFRLPTPPVPPDTVRREVAFESRCGSGSHHPKGTRRQ